MKAKAWLELFGLKRGQVVLIAINLRLITKSSASPTSLFLGLLTFFNSMANSPSKLWLPLLSASSVVLGAALSVPSAQAQPLCTDGLLVQFIVNATNYACDLGGVTYYFNSSMSELSAASSAAALYFTDSATVQTINFRNLANSNYIAFSYQIQSPLYQIDAIDQTYQFQNPSTPPPVVPPTGVETSVPNFPPSPPSNLPFTVDVQFQPADPPPTPVVTSLTYTIHKSPAPLPLLGTGFAFAFQRRIRERIKHAS
jgi:hypothetical protein